MPMIIEGPESAFKKIVISKKTIVNANERFKNTPWNRATKTIGKQIARKKQIERTTENFVTQNAFKDKSTSVLESFKNIFRKK